MIDIPGLPVGSLTTTRGTQADLQPTRANVLDGIRSLTTGSIVDALVVRLDPGRVPVVQVNTPQGQNAGEIPLNTQLQLTVGNQLQLRVLENSFATQNFTQSTNLNSQLTNVVLPTTPAPATVTPSQQTLSPASAPPIANPTISAAALAAGAASTLTTPTQTPAPSASPLPFAFEAEVVSLNGRQLTVTPTQAVQVTVGEGNTQQAPSQNSGFNRVSLYGTTVSTRSDGLAQSVAQTADNVSESTGNTIRGVVITPSRDSGSILQQLVQNVPSITTPNTALASSDRLSFKLVSVQPLAENSSFFNQSVSIQAGGNQAIDNSGLPQQPATRIPAAYQDAAALLKGATTTASPAPQLPPNSLASGILPALVLGHEGADETVVQTALGTIKLQGLGSLPTGSTVQLQLTDIKTANPNSGQALFLNDLKLGTRQLMLAGESPLQDALDMLQTSSPELAKMVISQLPQMVKDPTQRASGKDAAQQAAAKLLWFVSNLQGGSATEWLGEHGTRELKQHSPETLNRLEQAFSQMRTLANEPNQSGWYNYLMPAYDEDKLTYIQAWVKREGGKKKRDSNKEDVRFLVEVTLDQLGDFQIDGFVHKQHTTQTDKTNRLTKLDIIVRTHQELPQAMQTELYSLFTENIAQTGVEGRLQFQAAPYFPNHFETPPAPGTEESIIV